MEAVVHYGYKPGLICVDPILQRGNFNVMYNLRFALSRFRLPRSEQSRS